jgi:predicted site-specific integrase-resolvase
MQGLAQGYLYPEHELIKDIGSGLNFKRKGVKSPKSIRQKA